MEIPTLLDAEEMAEKNQLQENKTTEVEETLENNEEAEESE
ncbi:MAG: hypothetical protein ACJZ37_00875 [Candidatus Poseidoniales archaeon]